MRISDIIFNIRACMKIELVCRIEKQSTDTQLRIFSRLSFETTLHLLDFANSYSMSYIWSTKVLHVQKHLLEVICGGLNWTVTLKV